jgi:tetratricopeptide (TPR) repeat protein
VRPSIPIHEAEEEEVGSLPPWPEDMYAPKRRRAAGWIALVLLLGGVGLLAVAAEKRFHVIALATQHGAPEARQDPRAEAFVTEGDRDLAMGDLDGAQAAYDKASVLLEHDPRVRLGSAHVAAAKADIPWLRLRLLPPEPSDDARTTKAQLDERAAAARRAADDAVSAAPQDTRALCAKLDALRLSGDIGGARGYVVAVFAQAAQPETAYALAALDLAQPGVASATVVDRLRLASGGEATPGRATAALVYALVNAGDLAGAKAELTKLDGAARPYPLLPNLHTYADRKAETAAAPAASSAASAAPVASAAPAPAAAAATPPANAFAGGAPAFAGGASDEQVGLREEVGHASQTTLRTASEAVRSGDFERAERIYRAILANDPNDSQALAGLGDIRRVRGDPSGAIDAYKRAIAVNPSLLPALLGLADTQWSRGDRAAAVRIYKNVVDHFPEETYPAYVSQRAGGGS